MSNPIKFCEIHSCKKQYYHAHKKYECRQCKIEYAVNYRKNNPDKIRQNNINQAKKRRAFVKRDKVINPDKYEKLVVPSQWCDIHKCKKVLGTDHTFVCRKCKKEYADKYRKSNPTYRQVAKKQVLKKFNLLKEEYEKMVSDCNNKCHICKQPEKRMICGRIIDLAIDHCHKSEAKGIIKIRGLLCRGCNNALGIFEDSIDLLQSAITYLRKHNCE